MPQRRDEQLRAIECMLDALNDWGDAVGELHRLGQQQLDVLLSAANGSLKGILDRKERVYAAAQELSGRVLELEKELPAEAEVSERWQEISRLRGEILQTMTDLAKMEARSQQLVRDRMRQIQGELEGRQRSRAISGAYGNNLGKSPRFLDQMR